MKKTVRLTESDLIRLIKRVINEQEFNKEQYEIITPKQLEKMGYVGHITDLKVAVDMGIKLRNSGVTAVGDSEIPAFSSLKEKLNMKGISYKYAAYGSYVSRKLPSGDVELLWIIKDS